MGCYFTTKVTKAEAIMTTISNRRDTAQQKLRGVETIVSAIPEPTERRIYGVCGAFHFCAAVFLGLLLLSLALTDARDLGPLVSI
jgi:hypothetical protein